MQTGMQNPGYLPASDSPLASQFPPCCGTGMVRIAASVGLLGRVSAIVHIVLTEGWACKGEGAVVYPAKQ